MMRVSSESAGQFRRLAVLIAVNFVDMIGFMIVLPLLPFYALKLHATPETIGRLIAAFSVAQLLAAPIWGRVSDRYGRRPALLIGLSASALAYAVFGFATSVWLLFLSRLVQGAGGGTTGVAQAYVADTVEPADRARALGWLSAATSAGVMVGPAIGSFAAHFGQAAPGIIAAALCLINVFFAWKWLPESHKEPAAISTKPRKPIWHPAWMALRHPTTPIGRLLWIYGVGMLAFASMTSVLALYLGAEFSIDETSIGYVFLYVGVLSFVMRSLLLGPIVDRIGETWAMRIGTVLLVLGLALYPLPRDLWTLALVIPLVPIGTALLFPATTSLMSRHSDPAELGTTMGVAQTFAGLARVMAPVLATIAFQRLGHGWPFYTAGALVALVGIMAFQVDVHPRVAKRAAEGAEA
ncbi:MAG TPA: MFS transporter [Gemmatimonadales bacterium]|jgi:multidrug resistance protein